MKKLILKGKTIYLNVVGIVKANPYKAKSGKFWIEVEYPTSKQNLGEFETENDAIAFMEEMFRA